MTPPLLRSPVPTETQRQRDDNKNKICTFEGGGPRGQRGKSSKNAVFRGKRHDNKILKAKILLSRNFVVVAQAPRNPYKAPSKNPPKKQIL